MTESLPNEDEVLSAISEILSDEFGSAMRLLTFGASLPTTIRGLHRSSLRNDTVVAAVALYTKAMTSFRASIHLCRIGCDRNAIPVNRSLFETSVNLAFLVRRRVTLYRFNDNNKMNPKTPVNLHGKKLTTDFRTDLYGAWNMLMSEKKVRRFSTTPGVKRSGLRLKKKCDEMERPYVDAVGADWEKAIRNANTCVGLSIKDFAASLGYLHRFWHGLIYSSDSQHVHQSDMTDFLDGNECDGSYWPRWFTSPDQVRTTLYKATLLSLGCIEEFNNRFKEGDAVKVRVSEYAEELKSWNL